MKVYEEIVDFISAGTTPHDVASFHPSIAVKNRVADLIHREKIGQLTRDEISELDHFMQLEHIMRLAKARAQNFVTHE